MAINKETSRKLADGEDTYNSQMTLDSGIARTLGMATPHFNSSNSTTLNAGLIMATSGVTLYLRGTPNGWKPTILLEELQLPYDTYTISFAENEQKSDWFTKISPNGRIPAIVDHDNDDFCVFESAAILYYLCEKAGDAGVQFVGRTLKERSQVMQWVMWQMGGLGPMMGQSNHFQRYAAEDVTYSKKRYMDETLRLLTVLNTVLEGKEYICGEGKGFYSLADISCFGWTLQWKWGKLPLDQGGYENVLAWLERLSQRPAVQKAIFVPPTPHGHTLIELNKMPAEEFEAILAPNFKAVSKSLGFTKSESEGAK